MADGHSSPRISGPSSRMTCSTERPEYSCGEAMRCSAHADETPSTARRCRILPIHHVPMMTVRDRYVRFRNCAALPPYGRMSGVEFNRVLFSWANTSAPADRAALFLVVAPNLLTPPQRLGKTESRPIAPRSEDKNDDCGSKRATSKMDSRHVAAAAQLRNSSYCGKTAAHNGREMR